MSYRSEEICTRPCSLVCHVFVCMISTSLCQNIRQRQLSHFSPVFQSKWMFIKCKLVSHRWHPVKQMRQRRAITEAAVNWASPLKHTRHWFCCEKGCSQKVCKKKIQSRTLRFLNICVPVKPILCQTCVTHIIGWCSVLLANDTDTCYLFLPRETKIKQPVLCYAHTQFSMKWRIIIILSLCFFPRCRDAAVSSSSKLGWQKYPRLLFWWRKMVRETFAGHRCPR